MFAYNFYRYYGLMVAQIRAETSRKLINMSIRMCYFLSVQILVRSLDIIAKADTLEFTRNIM